MNHNKGNVLTKTQPNLITTVLVIQTKQEKEHDLNKIKISEPYQDGAQ